MYKSILLQDASVAFIDRSEQSADGRLVGGQLSLHVESVSGRAVKLALIAADVILELINPGLPGG
jgi:hypothetical protein